MITLKPFINQGTDAIFMVFNRNNGCGTTFSVILMMTLWDNLGFNLLYISNIRRLWYPGNINWWFSHWRVYSVRDEQLLTESICSGASLTLSFMSHDISESGLPWLAWKPLCLGKSTSRHRESVCARVCGGGQVGVALELYLCSQPSVVQSSAEP